MAEQQTHVTVDHAVYDLRRCKSCPAHMREMLLYIVIAMVAYDLSIHLIYLLRKEALFMQRKLNYWPDWPGHNHNYQIFWSIYWGTAFVLLLAYAVT